MNEFSPELTRQALHPAMPQKVLLRATELVELGWTRGTAATDADGQKLRSTVPQATAWGVFAEKGMSGGLVRQPDDSRQRAPQSQATVEGAGGTNAPARGSLRCVRSFRCAARQESGFSTGCRAAGASSAACYLADDATGWSGGVSIPTSMAHLPR
jgi:hypothetical protein